MRKRNLATAMFAFIAFIAIISVAYAAPSSPTALNVIQSSTRDTTTLPTQTAQAQGGNVTEINIAALTITKSWQGYYGNITGQIALQDAGNNTFYNWSMTNFKGRVYATRTSAITWSSLVNCSNSTAVAAEETYLGQAATDGDSVTNTFSSTTHQAFSVGPSNILANTCYSTNGYVNGNAQSANYTMVLLQQDNNIIYTTLTNKSVTGFDGKQHDFQLLVGENERTGSTGPTTYYFWTEFD